MADALIETVLTSFGNAKAAIENAFGARSAEEIVKAVNRKEMPRSGRCNGLDYFVHGVGYTVVMPSGGQVHIDSCEVGGDCFSLYDLRFFIETSGLGVVPTLESLRLACEDLVSLGRLRQLDRNKFGLR